MLAILNECEISSDAKENNGHHLGLIITETHLYIIESIQNWIADRSPDGTIESYQQLMSNLVEIEKLADAKYRINFLDENQDKCELWTCSFETNSNAESTLNAISQSWEQLFGVSLTY